MYNLFDTDLRLGFQGTMFSLKQEEDTSMLPKTLPKKKFVK